MFRVPRKPWVSFLLLSLIFSATGHAAQQGAKSATPSAKGLGSAIGTNTGKPALKTPLLPPSFAGEPLEGDLVSATDPAIADAAHVAVLKEDGLQQSTVGHYSGSGGAGWTVQSLRFGDATGAYSAFTFYRNATMEPEPVGDNAAADNNTFLARSTATLVIVHASGLGATTQDARRLTFAMIGLVQGLPLLQGPDAVAPALPGLLPKDGLDAASMHYAIGPAGYNGPLPVTALAFDRSAEIATAHYRLHSGGTAVLTLEMLPTPQIAGAAQRAVQGLPDQTLHVDTLRTGPLLGIVSGSGVSPADAHRLLNQIHYVADLTLDQPEGYTSEVAKAAKLLLGIAYLTGILAAAAVLLAVFLGGGRVLIRRMRGKPDSSLNDDDFISLKL